MSLLLTRFVGVVVAAGFFLSGTIARCEEVHELLGHSFSTTLHDTKTDTDHTVRVQIGKRLQGRVVDFVVTFDPPFPEDTKIPRRFVGKGSINKFAGNDDWHEFCNGQPIQSNTSHMEAGESYPKGCDEWMISIGGCPDSEFKARGRFQIYSSRFKQDEGWEK